MIDRQRMQARLLVGLQFALSAALVLGPFLGSNESASLATARGCMAVLAVALGIAIFAWAIALMRLRRLRIMPEPSPAAQLITAGPYRFVRHPMYSGLLLAGIGIVLWQPAVAQLLVWSALLVTLDRKAALEEKHLLKRFPLYAEYRDRTWRLVPLVW